jgi:hypothetical protein
VERGGEILAKLRPGGSGGSILLFFAKISRSLGNPTVRIINRLMLNG